MSVRVALAVLLLCAAGCGAGHRDDGADGADVDAEPVATDVVEMPRHYRFEPVAIRVTAGTTVTWRNTDDFTHSVRLDLDGAQVHVVRPGDSLRLTFDEPGRYPYTCTLHPHNMRGVVVVE